MDKGTKIIIGALVTAISTIISVLICLAIVSCGKRITSIERTEIKNDSIHIENKVKLTQNATFNDIGSVKPFDAKKPMLFNGKWYYNTIIEFDKTIKKGIEIKAGENLSYTGSESIEKNKQVEKTDYSNSIIGVIFVLALFLFLYIYLKNWKP